MGSVGAGLGAWGCGAEVEDAAPGPQLAGEVSGLTLTPTRGWTQSDVDEVLASLKGVDPATYLVRVPVLTRGVITGQATYGRLSLREVESTATWLNVRLQPGSNIIQAEDLRSCDGGTMMPASASGQDLTSRLGTILTNIDATQYQLLR